MNIQTETCPICGEGGLHEIAHSRPVEIDGHKGYVHTRSSECDVCGCVQASPTQLRDNLRAMTAFEKEAVGRLTGKQMREARTKLGLTQVDAAKIFGGGKNSFAKYEADDVTQSEAMDNLVRLAIEIPAARYWLHSKASIKATLSETEQTLAQQTYNFMIDIISGTTYVRSAESNLQSLVSTLPIAGAVYSLKKRINRHSHAFDSGPLVNLWNDDIAQLDSVTQMYDKAVSIHPPASTMFNEEDYERHTRR